MPLLNRYKNALLETIESQGLSRDEFSTSDETAVINRRATELFVIRVVGTDCRFVIQISSTSHDRFNCAWSMFAPNDPMSGWPDIAFEAIHLVQRELGNWIESVVKRHAEESEVPNLWDEAAEELEALTTDDQLSPTLDGFSEPERDLLKAATEQIKAQIVLTFDPVGEQLVEINRKLDYMAAAVDRLSKRDWKAVVISTMLGVITNLGVDRSVGSQVYQIFKNGLNFAFRLIG